MNTFKVQFTNACFFLLFCLLLAPSHASELKKSHEFGDVLIKQAITTQSREPVIFRHWIHRSKHSCRLCHVDIEFSMEAGATGILEDDNKEGRYCGTCHNGKEAFSLTECSQCHPKDAKDTKAKKQAAKKAFFIFKKNLPRSTYGNKIDWNKAEENGLIKAKDFIEGISFPAEKLNTVVKNDIKIAELNGLPGIIFSHEKHIAWTGCGMCHPAPFALEKGKTTMTMKEITEGNFCGICHGNVAFPINDCSKCHVTPVN